MPGLIGAAELDCRISPEKTTESHSTRLFGGHPLVPAQVGAEELGFPLARE
jgi:hypothetical protein